MAINMRDSAILALVPKGLFVNIRASIYRTNVTSPFIMDLPQNSVSISIKKM